MNEQTTPISVFQAQASNGLKDQLRVYPITRDSEYADALEFVSFTRPTDVMVSRWYPGYRVTDLTGKQAEEGIGLMLANTLTTIEALENFRRLLATPDLASEIITTLLPRANVAVRGRQYLMSEELVGKTTSEIMDRRGWTVPELQAAYSHAITRVLSSLELVQPGVDKRVVNVAPTYAVSAEDISRIILIESMRDVFSEIGRAHV